MIYPNGKLTERFNVAYNSYLTQYGIKLPWFAKEIWRVAPIVAKKHNVPKDASKDGIMSFTDMQEVIYEINRIDKSLANIVRGMGGNKNGFNNEFNNEFNNLLNKWYHFSEQTSFKVEAMYNILAINEADPEEIDEDGGKRYIAEMDFYNQGNDGWMGPNIPCPVDHWPSCFKRLNFAFHDLYMNLNDKKDSYAKKRLDFNRQFYINTRSRRILEVRRKVSSGKQIQTNTKEHRWIGRLDEDKATIEILPFVWESHIQYPKRSPECGGMSRTSSVSGY